MQLLHAEPYYQYVLHYTCLIPSQYPDSAQQTDLVHKIVHCLLKEYEEASWEQYSTSSVWIKQLLFPHLEAFLEVHGRRHILPLCCYYADKEIIRTVKAALNFYRL